MDPRTVSGEDDQDFLDAFLSTAFATDPDGSGEGSGSAEAEGRNRIVPAPPLEKTPERIGPYPVIDRIGLGGVGIVWRVQDPELDRHLAVKLLRAHLREDRAMRSRLEEEARICSRLEHPGIVPVHARGHAADGRPWFAMRLVDGRTLAEEMESSPLEAPAPDPAQRPPQRLHELLEVFEQLASALAYAHACGIVHGDVKPQNVMVGSFGEVQVMDWGFAFEVSGERAAELAPRVGGTPSYMSPEQARGDRKAIAPRTDVFGLGAVLCEILTGAPPYRGQTRREVVAQASIGALEDAWARLDRCGASATLVATAKRCLNADVDARFADASQVVREIRDHFANLDARARALEIEAATQRARALSERRARRLWLTLVSMVAGLTVILTAAFFWARASEAERSAETRRGYETLRERAETLFHQAERDALERSDLWSGVVAAAEQARTWLRARSAPEELQREGEALLDRARGRASEVEHAVDLRERILALRAEIVDDRHLPAAESRYRALFDEIGVDPDRAEDQSEAAARIEASLVREHLVQTLDAWTLLRRRNLLPDPRAWRRTLALARLVDADPFREALRQAFAEEDVERFLSLIETRAGDPAIPARSHELVAQCLIVMRERERAIGFLRQAVVVHPGDANLAHTLCSFLAFLDPPPYAEMERLLWMAHAVRPDDAHLLVDLARVLLLVKRDDEVRDLLDRAEQLDPEEERIPFFRGALLETEGDPAGATRAFEESLRRGFSLAVEPLARMRIDTGCLATALELLHHPLRQQRRDPLGASLEADLLSRIGRIDEALALLDRANGAEPEEPVFYLLRATVLLRGARIDAVEALLDRPPQTAARSLAKERTALATELDQLRGELETLATLRSDPTAREALRSGELLRYGRLAARSDQWELALDLLAPLADESVPLVESRYEAARAAWTLAARNADLAAGRPDRERAHDWLRGEFETLDEDLEVGLVSLVSVRDLLSRTKVDVVWEAARRATPGLAPDEGAKWSALWARLDARLAEIGCP